MNSRRTKEIRKILGQNEVFGKGANRLCRKHYKKLPHKDRPEFMAILAQFAAKLPKDLGKENKEIQPPKRYIKKPSLKYKNEIGGAFGKQRNRTHRPFEK